MYSFYIKNFWIYDGSGNRSYNQTRQLIYTVPIADPDRAFIDPVIKCEMGKAGSFEFSITPNNPFYKAWRQFKTLLYVEYEGTTIFHGRVLTIDNGLMGTKKIHCEGDLAFLLDSVQPLSVESTRSNIAMNNYIRQILAKHNQQMYEIPSSDTDEQGIGSGVNSSSDMEKTDRMISVGEIPGEYSNASDSNQRVANVTRKFGSKNWEQSMNALETLTKEFGGYFRTRYSTYTAAGREWDVCYLDWLDNYFRKNDSDGAAIEVSKNLIDLNSTTEVENVFTVLLPIGTKDGKDLYLDGYEYKSGNRLSSRYLTVPFLDWLCAQGVIAESRLSVGYHTRSEYREAVNNFGYVYKTQKFDNADTQAKLFSYAVDWLIGNYIGGVTNFTVSALDLHHYNPNIYTSKYLVGDRIKLKYPDPDTMVNGTPTVVAKTLTLLSIEYHPHNPEKNSYTIGTPSQILSKEYGAAAKKTKTTKSAASTKKQNTTEEETKAELGEVNDTLWTAVINNYYNHDMYKELDPTETKAILKSQYLFLKQANDNPKGSAGLLLDGWNGKIVFDADNPRDEHLALKKMEMYGDNFKYIRHIIESEQVISTVGFSIDADGLMQASQVLLGENAEGEKVAINLDGLDGLMSMFGIDGSTGEMFKSLDISGFQNFLKFFSKPDAQGNQKETIKQDGNDGKADYGKDADGNWLITINEPLTYIDSQGQQKQVPAGTVSGKDFYLAEVPSFKTELAVMNTAIIGKASIGQLESVEGFIQNLSSERATIEVVSAKRGVFNTLTTNGTSTAASYKYRGTNQTENTLENCFINASMEPDEENPGVIKLNFYRANQYDVHESGTKTVTFNMADTQFYQDAVSAAETYGRNHSNITYEWAKYGDPLLPSTQTNMLKINRENLYFGRQIVKAFSTYNSSSHNYSIAVQAGDNVPSSSSDGTNVYNLTTGTDAYNAGHTAGIPVSGSAGGPNFTGSQAHIFTINSYDGTSRQLTINCANIYATARSGYYTQAQYDARYSEGGQSAWFVYTDHDGHPNEPKSTNYGLAPGKYMTGFYRDADGTMHEWDTSWGPVPTGTAISSGNLQIGNYGYATTEPSGTNASGFWTALKNAQADPTMKYFKFRVWCQNPNDTSQILASKWYQFYFR